MSDNPCTCPSCSAATLIGSETAGLCTSCGTFSLAGNAVPLVAVVLVALAARALVVAHRRAQPVDRFLRATAAAT
ncbi:MAG: hypothetical protein FJW80_12185 [Actinobacteria bacterium]|nr:hypothetical protein [Actinomycetota bacterium]